MQQQDIELINLWLALGECVHGYFASDAPPQPRLFCLLSKRTAEIIETDGTSAVVFCPDTMESVTTTLNRCSSFFIINR